MGRLTGRAGSVPGRGTSARHDVEVDVVEALGSASPVVLRGWVRWPDSPEGPAAVGGRATPVVYCLAGGGCSGGYFDLVVEGHDDYGMAEHFAGRGAVVVALDHLGIGASEAVEDLYAVTPTVLTRCHDVAARQVLARLRAGELVPGAPPIEPFAVGLGHSMGGMLATVQQARHGTYDALVLLGHGGTGLPEVLTEDELAVSGPDLPSIEPDVVRLALIRFGPNSPVTPRKPRLGAFFTDDVPPEVRQAFAAQSVPLLPTCGLTSMIPCSTHAERAAVAVPTFIGFGDHDLIDDYTGTVAQYRSVTDAALFVLAGSGHCHNQAPGRRLLWDRVLDWIGSIAAT